MADLSGDHFSSTEDELFWSLHFRTLLDYLPVIIFLSLSGCIGLVGNVFAVRFYGRIKSSTPFVFLVQALAWMDGIVSCLLLLGAGEIAFGVAFRYRYICKVSYFLFEWSIYTSVFILVLITVDRYKNICRPFGKQLSKRVAKYSIFVILGITFLTSIRNVVIYDVVSTNITVQTDNRTYNVVCFYCTNSVSPSLETAIKCFHIFDIIVASIIFVLFTTTYGLILRKLLRHRKLLKSLDNVADGRHTMETNGKHSTSSSQTNSQVFMTKSYKTHESQQVVMGKRIKKSEYRISIMMLLVTVVFLVSLAPFFVAVLVFRQSADSEHALTSYTQFMMKSVFLNSVANPIIYYIYNDKFRTYVNNVVTCRPLGSAFERYSRSIVMNTESVNNDTLHV